MYRMLQKSYLVEKAGFGYRKKGRNREQQQFVPKVDRQHWQVLIVPHAPEI